MSALSTHTQLSDSQNTLKRTEYIMENVFKNMRLLFGIIYGTLPNNCPFNRNALFRTKGNCWEYFK